MDIAGNALELLLIFVALSMIVGGDAGRRWAFKLIGTPIKMLLGRLEAQVQRIVTVLVYAVLFGFGLWALYVRAMAALSSM